MKQRLIFAALLGIAMASCQKEEVSPETNFVSQPVNPVDVDKSLKPSDPTIPKPVRPEITKSDQAL